MMNVEQVRQTITEMARQANAEARPLGHILIGGAPPLLQEVITPLWKTLPFQTRRLSARNFQRAGDLASVVIPLKRSDVLFVDEIQHFTQAVVEIFSVALTENKVDIVFGKGLEAKNARLDLQSFTIIATTPQIERLPSRIVACFPVQFRLVP
jgi:Holliday junction resolvasome RuvABC ATP-dependent DNA helicase subunit